eukprot:CAMPEP_0117744246 /NCGR_PEP_ID=MMETSP0947-20121206/6638_1 /TAXON_ID=44440 /ORGANISM="Chattonella subsalsa, Strain CCMP2191" /LENGTH=166 /DNA_ID=CAMNT_0005561145 /DNA_START=53 /DNA_END=549 /DNA_ORIENTATION=-
MLGLGEKEGDQSAKTNLKRQKIGGDEKTDPSTWVSDLLKSELKEETTLQEEIAKASKSFVQENIYGNSNSSLNSTLFPECIQTHMLLNCSGKNKESNNTRISQNECQLGPTELIESNMGVLNEKESRVQDEKHYTQGNTWKYIRVSIPQNEAMSYFSFHNKQPDIS